MNTKKTIIAGLLGRLWFRFLAATLLAAVPVIIAALVLAASAALPADRGSRGAAVAGPAEKAENTIRSWGKS